MANYRFKSTTVEAYQSNQETFDEVYNWAMRNNCPVSEKTADTYKITQTQHAVITVHKTSVVWLLKLSDGAWLASSDERFQQLFEAA